MARQLAPAARLAWLLAARRDEMQRAARHGVPAAPDGSAHGPLPQAEPLSGADGAVAAAAGPKPMQWPR
ncbi:MAG: hypothetical protein N2512_04375 [Armatimonadetes bacterium]|nr:hypothetical protein [Armatimonadota bacterium]